MNLYCKYVESYLESVNMNRFKSIQSHFYSVLTVLVLFMSFVLAGYAQHTEKIGNRSFYVHVVKAKETIYGISRQYNVHQDTIYHYNPSAINGIKIDQILRFPVPVESITPVKHSIHIVEQGETLYGIAKKYQTTVKRLTELNPFVKNGLQPNQELVIPSDEEDKEISPIHEVNNEPNKEMMINKQEIQPVKIFDKCQTYRTEKKSFKIAFLLPFTTSGKLNTRIASEFFGGARVALDSIRAKGINLEIFVYDTKSKNDSDQVLDILLKPEMQYMDLIIGPLYSANLGLVADYASARNIPLVTPFSRLSSLLSGKPYLIKVTPDEQQVASRTIKYFKTFYPDANYILIDPGIKKDSLQHLYYQEALKTHISNDNSSVHSVRLTTAGGAISKIQKDKKNILIFPCSREITVKDYLAKLNNSIDKADISIVGTEDWLEFNNVEADYYENMNLHIPTVNYASYTDSASVSFIQQYQKIMKVDPGIYASKGYIVTLQMLQLLTSYGEKTCECLHQSLTTDAYYTFDRKSSSDGWYNQSIQMMVFRNYSYRFINY